jgi:hypothetical protein
MNSRAKPPRFHLATVDLPTKVLTAVLDLCNGHPLDRDLTASDIIEILIAIDAFSIPENHLHTIKEYVTTHHDDLCPNGPADHKEIVPVLCLANQTHSTALLGTIMRRLVKGSWGAKLKIDRWTEGEQHLVGNALCGTLNWIEANRRAWATANTIMVEFSPPDQNGAPMAAQS